MFHYLLMRCFSSFFLCKGKQCTRGEWEGKKKKKAMSSTTFEWFIFDLLKLNQKSIIYYISFFRAPFFCVLFCWKSRFLGLCFTSIYPIQSPDLIEDSSRNFKKSQWWLISSSSHCSVVVKNASLIVHWSH